MKIKPEVRLKTRILPFITAVLVFMQLIDSSRVWMMLLVSLGGVWLVGYLWARSLANHLQFEREMRFGWAQVGDLLEERFTLTNNGSLPALWVEIIDHSDMPGHNASRVTGVDGGSSNRWLIKGVCNRRGIFTLGPSSLDTSDPFGIYGVCLHKSASTNIMVMPPIVPLPAIEVAPGEHTGEGRPRTNAPEQTVSSSSVREFVHGDSLRWIHWRTSARRDSPYVRVFDGTPAADWWIFLDLDQRVQAGEGSDSTEEHGVILAASLAERGLQSGKAVGLASNSEELVWLPPQDSESQRWNILHALAMVSSGSIPLAQLFARNKPFLSHRTSLIIITPNIESDWIEPLLPLLWRGAIPTILLLDPSSFGRTHPRSVDINTSVSMLVDLGIAHYIITRDLLDRPEARPGQEGQWEWRFSATGRALPMRKPTNLHWKVLS